jgi:hypothetical protein
VLADAAKIGAKPWASPGATMLLVNRHAISSRAPSSS